MGVVSGTFQYADGTPISNASYQWKLNVDAVILGTACVAPVIVNGNLSTTGAMVATLDFNDILGTAGGTTTTYQLTVKDIHGGQVWNENYYLTGTAANINLVAPGSGTAGAIFFPTFPGNALDSVQSFSASGAVGFAGAISTFIKATAGVSGITLTAVTAVGVAGQRMRIKQMDTFAAGVLVVGTALQTFDGAPNLFLTNQYQTYTIESDNANWNIVAAFG